MSAVLNVDRGARTGFGIGVGFVVAGGLIAAIASPLDVYKGSWLAAYVVLIAGVSQCLLAVLDHMIGVPDAASRPLALRLLGWNLGNVLVVLGVYLEAPLVVDAGGLVLAVVLVLALVATRGASAKLAAAVVRIALVALVVSIPIGLVLAHVRAAA